MINQSLREQLPLTASVGINSKFSPKKNKSVLKRSGSDTLEVIFRGTDSPSLVLELNLQNDCTTNICDT